MDLDNALDMLLINSKAKFYFCEFFRVNTLFWNM